ncbi:MAG: hypothetical protein ABI296_11780, partial [Gammaproteobacteria bacterium]
MNDALLQKQVVEQPSNGKSYIHELFDKAEGILLNHRHENPDLYRMIEEQKIIKEAKEKKAAMSEVMTSAVADTLST